ncbi:hypothetical protein NLJ89_g9901 [Agrocybe chaxingu]|uniref:Uncharacterized protein n=1 Tax=Agrocybe chaxingu TaxID=84603 RepID=A0A9W8JRK4_9AGAR|nr:hypothetical protein NLJ89_g9901 [Agrocybe chaxingu]
MSADTGNSNDHAQNKQRTKGRREEKEKNRWSHEKRTRKHYPRTEETKSRKKIRLTYRPTHPTTPLRYPPSPLLLLLPAFALLRRQSLPTPTHLKCHHYGLRHYHLHDLLRLKQPAPSASRRNPPHRLRQPQPYPAHTSYAACYGAKARNARLAGSRGQVDRMPRTQIGIGVDTTTECPEGERVDSEVGGETEEGAEGWGPKDGRANVGATAEKALGTAEEVVVQVAVAVGIGGVSHVIGVAIFPSSAHVQTPATRR